jgi:hypothetical protein
MKSFAAVLLFAASCSAAPQVLSIVYTDKKENYIFLIYKEIQKGEVAQSYITTGLLIYD